MHPLPLVILRSPPFLDPMNQNVSFHTPKIGSFRSSGVREPTSQVLSRSRSFNHHVFTFLVFESGLPLRKMGKGLRSSGIGTFPTTSTSFRFTATCNGEKGRKADGISGNLGDLGRPRIV